MRANDYNLVHGLPGTGKTHMIVVLLKILIEEGQKVLLSAPTHFAIDNILERFVEEYPALRHKIVRISSKKESVSQKLRDLVHETIKKKTHLEPGNIIGVTCQAAPSLKLSNYYYNDKF